MGNLEKVVWTDELSLSSIDIDNEHKKLLEICNDLIDLYELNNNREEFARILSNMTDYGLVHFKREEKYMQDFSYPKFTEHKQYHRDYIYKVAMYNVDLFGADSPDLLEIIKFLKKWWTNHIMRNDSDYENYRNKIQSDAKYGRY